METSGSSRETSDSRALPETVTLPPVQESAFADLLRQCITETVRDGLSPTILEILRERNMLDDPTDTHEFHRRLVSMFGSSSDILERLVVKEFYRRLRLAYDSESYLSYEDCIDDAKGVWLVK